LPDGLIISMGNDISQRTREVAQIQKVESEYQLLFENMNEGFALCRMIYDENMSPVDWVILKVNNALERNAGLTSRQLIGKRITQIFPNLDPFWFKVFGQVAMEGKKTTFQKFFPELNRNYEISAFSPLPDQFATIITDITKRKAADERVRKQLMEITQYQKRLKNLNAQLIDAEESERRRIAEFLHDDLGQLLSAAHLKLTSMANCSSPPIKQKKITETASELINNSINLCRQMTYDLNTPILKKFGLLAALKWKLSEVQKIFGIKTTMRIHNEQFSLSESLNNLLFRVLAEIINNAAKHSKCTNIILEITGNEKSVLFSVFDDGIGFDFDKVMANQQGIKYGLFNISERLFPVSGKLMVETTPGKGSKVGVLMKIS